MELSEVFVTFSLSKQRLETIFNQGSGVETVKSILENLNIDISTQIKILASLTSNFSPDKVLQNQKSVANTHHATVICLQGSISYLMLQKEINLANKLVETTVFMAKVTAALKLVGPSSRQEAKSLEDIANQLFALVLFKSCPFVRSKFIFSQRTFDADHAHKWPSEPRVAATVATQVWLGYLVARYQDKQWKPKSMGGAISIDIGTAKIAFGYAEAQECPGKSLPIVRSYDLTKLIKQTDSAGICKELDKIIEVMDVRHSDSATQVLDPEFRDFKVKYLAFINSDDGIKAAILEAHMQMYSAGALTEHKSWLKIAAAVYKHDDTYGMYADEAIEKARRHKARDAEAVLLRKIAEYHYRFEMSDFDRLYGLCERLVQYLATVFDTLESTYGVQLTGKEPVFFFGTMHMRKWLKDSERNHGSRCYELLGTMETFLNVFLKRKLKPDQGDGENRYYGQEHTVKLEICSQSDEATYEHKAFLAAFASSKVDTIETECEDEDVDGKKTLFEALQDNLVGNLAYGKGSMQGVPNGKTNINCELGLHRIMQCIEEESINYGGVVFLDQKKKKRVSFDPATCNSTKCDSFIRACQQRIIDDLKILSPQLLWDDTWLKIQRPPMTFTSEIEEGLQEHHHVNIEDAFQNIEEAFQ